MSTSTENTAHPPARPPVIGPRHPGGQAHQRLIRFRHKSEVCDRDQAEKLGRAVALLASRRETISDFHYRVRPLRDAYRLDLTWSYGWVKGGWPSDGHRLYAQGVLLAMVEPVPGSTELSLERESKRPVPTD